MKTKNILILFALLITLSNQTYAQFHTIGDIDSRVPHKQKDHPSEQPVLRDSLLSDDTLSLTDSTSSSSETMLFSVPVSCPLKQIKIGSKFGMRMHPIYHKWMMHNGVDLSAQYEEVYSMFPGTVIRVGQDDRSGKFVTVRTGNYTVSYCHLSKPFVKVNDFVDAGTIIACSGNTGASTGPHLHLTTKKDGKAINPVILLDYIESVILNH